MTRHRTESAAERRSTSRRALLAGLGASVLGGLSGCTALSSGGGDGGGEKSYDVGMTSQAFRPPQVTARVGDEVVWKNTSVRNHSVTAYGKSIPDEATYFASGGFESEKAARKAWRDGLGGVLKSGDTYAHTFEVPGRYDYFCIPHEQAGMVGTVVVEK